MTCLISDLDAVPTHSSPATAHNNGTITSSGYPLTLGPQIPSTGMFGAWRSQKVQKKKAASGVGRGLREYPGPLVTGLTRLDGPLRHAHRNNAS